MLILLSDLHLADTVERSTINITRLLRRLEDIIKQAFGNSVESITLILLGDIFEILKSKKWIEHQVRPWEASTLKHIRTVDSIFQSVLESNQEFFAGIGKLKRDYPFLRIEYIPGNHDRPMNTEMG